MSARTIDWLIGKRETDPRRIILAAIRLSENEDGKTLLRNILDLNDGLQKAAARIEVACDRWPCKTCGVKGEPTVLDSTDQLCADCQRDSRPPLGDLRAPNGGTDA